MNQILKLWPAILSKQYTDAIIDIGNKQPVARTGIGFDASKSQANTKAVNSRSMQNLECLTRPLSSSAARFLYFHHSFVTELRQ